MPKEFLKKLKCRGECGREFDINQNPPLQVCEYDFGPLKVIYDYDAISKVVSRELIEKRPENMWRFLEFLPISSNTAPDFCFNTGGTPLVRASNLEKLLGVKEIWIKDDGVNFPSLSFKDRVVAMAIARAREFGYKQIGCASTGNLAVSVSAQARRAGMQAVVFIPKSLEPEKISAIAQYEPIMIAVDGVYDDINRLCSEIGMSNDFKDLPFANVDLRAFYGDGSKTYGMEIVQQLGWKAPRGIVVPAAGNSLINKIYQGIKELQLTGLIDEVETSMYAAQNEHCAPVSSAIIEGKKEYTPVPAAEVAKSIAKSLAIGKPANGNDAIKLIYDTGGYAAKASNEETKEGMRILAKDGVSGETAGGVVVSSLIKLVENGKIPQNEGPIIVCNTGNNARTPQGGTDIDPRFIIEPKVKNFAEVYNSIKR